MILEQDSLHSAAADYLAAGLCVLPARRVEKRPAVDRWSQFGKRLPTEAEVSAWFANPRNQPDAVCIVCGQVSGNGEMIDFDAGGELFDAWTQRIGSDLLARLVIETTQRDGRHVYYRCDQEICGNMKLSQRRDGEKITTLIETRGEGGLILCAPTAGYEIVQGDLSSPPRPTEKPVEVSEILIRQSSQPGEVVLDPFVGAGATGVAAVHLKRTFMGNDICQEALDITRRRLVEAGAEVADFRSARTVGSADGQLGLAL